MKPEKIKCVAMKNESQRRLLEKYAGLNYREYTSKVAIDAKKTRLWRRLAEKKRHE